MNAHATNSLLVLLFVAFALVCACLGLVLTAVDTWERSLPALSDLYGIERNWLLLVYSFL